LDEEQQERWQRQHRLRRGEEGRLDRSRLMDGWRKSSRSGGSAETLCVEVKKVHSAEAV
jgi:hypothetical protein